jgi:hypothetical protein
VTTKSEFYHDFLTPMGITRSFGPVILRDEQRSITIPAMRTESREPFGEEHRAIAAHLLPHVARAIQLVERLQSLQAGEEVIAGLPFGVIFLSSTGFVTSANRAAEHMFEQGDGLGVRLGMLTAATPQSTADLQAAIRQTLIVEQSTSWPKMVIVERPSERRPYQVMSFPPAWAERPIPRILRTCDGAFGRRS